MKGIALILTLIIFSTSLKATAFVSGVNMALQGAASTHSCCSINKESDLKDCKDSEENEEESDCCSGDNCGCTCCLHIAYMQQFASNAMQSNLFSEVKFDYSFLYQADFLTSIFHPPSIS